jgi:hypothetical protein
VQKEQKKLFHSFLESQESMPPNPRRLGQEDIRPVLPIPFAVSAAGENHPRQTLGVCVSYIIRVMLWVGFMSCCTQRASRDLSSSAGWLCQLHSYLVPSLPHLRRFPASFRLVLSSSTLESSNKFRAVGRWARFAE